MKLVKIFIIWIMIALVIELLGFSYLDKYYLAPDTTFIAIKIPSVAEPIVQKNLIKVSSDVNFSFILSYNGKYALYKEGQTLKILNTINGAVSDIAPENDETISFFRWVPESDRILLVKKQASQKKFKMYYYDAKSNDKLVEVRNYMTGSMEGQEISIPIKNPNAEVVDIDLSTYNGVMYVKLLNNGSRDEIYRMDRMANLQKINAKDLKSNMIGSIVSTKHSEKLVYEDLLHGKIYATGVKTPIMPKNVTKAVLLGIDSNDDTIYIGEIEKEKVTKVFYGYVEDNTEKWNVIVLNSPVSKDNVFVGSKGKVYVNNGIDGIVTDIRSGSTITYTGRLLQIYDEGLFSSSQSNLQKISFN